MKKLMKSAIILLLTGLVAAGCSSKPQSASPTNTGSEAPNATAAIKLELGHGGALDSHLNAGALKFKELVEKNTNNKVTINIHPNSELGAEREMTEAVQTELLDIAMVSTGPVGNFADKVNALDFPFLFKDRQHAYRVLDGKVGEEINKQLEGVNLKNLYWIENGTHHIVTNNKPIRTLEDLKGLKMRVQENQIQIDTFKALGTTPTPIPFSELFTAVQQGVVDGQSNAFPVLIPNKYYEVHKYMTLTGHMYSAGMILMNNTKFNSLPQDIQKALLDAAKEAGTYQREFVAQKEAEYRKIAEEKGMTIIDDVDLAPFREAVKPVYEKNKAKFGELHKIIFETN